MVRRAANRRLTGHQPSPAQPPAAAAAPARVSYFRQTATAVPDAPEAVERLIR